jgi:hypothetical protein
MVNFCVVCGRCSRTDKNTSFHRLPAVKSNVSEETKKMQEERRSLWLRRIRKTDILTSSRAKFASLRVCSKHFIVGKMSFMNFIYIIKAFVLVNYLI